MQPEIQQYPFGARPDVTRPNPEFLTFMGENGIRKLVNRHYDLMHESSIAHLFPTDKDEFEAAKKVQRYVEQELGAVVNQDELLYLTLHLSRLS